MFGKEKKEKEIEKKYFDAEKYSEDGKEKPSWQVKAEKLEKEKQEFISKKIELTEKELLAELLWCLSGGYQGSIYKKLSDIESNTDDVHNQKMRQADRFP